MKDPKTLDLIEKMIKDLKSKDPTSPGWNIMNLLMKEVRGLQKTLKELIKNEGEWHQERDCKAEHRSKDCGHCKILRKAKKLLGKKG